MDSKRALTRLIYKHGSEFKALVEQFKDAGHSRRTAKTKAAGKLASKYQKEYIRLRGKSLTKENV